MTELRNYLAKMIAIVRAAETEAGDKIKRVVNHQLEPLLLKTYPAAGISIYRHRRSHNEWIITVLIGIVTDKDHVFELAAAILSGINAAVAAGTIDYTDSPDWEYEDMMVNEQTVIRTASTTLTTRMPA